MAGKSWQPSHEPPRGRERASTCHTDKTVEEDEKGGGGGGGYDRSPNVPEETLTLVKKRILTSLNATTHLGPRARGILAHTLIEMLLTREG